MRRARSLQQRMHLQQQQQEEEEEEQQQPSEKPLSLQILLTDRPTDQSAVSQDHQAPPLHPCHVKASSAAPPSSSGTPTGSPREDSRAGGALPALCDTCGQSPLEDLAPPPLHEEAGPSTQWGDVPPVPTPPPPWPYSQSPPPVNTSHLMMEEAPYYVTQPLTTPPATSPTSILAPPPSRHWSCYHLDSPDAVDFPDLPTYNPPLPPPSRPSQTCSPLPHQDHGPALPVERWAQNVNRYYGSQSAAEGGQSKGSQHAPGCHGVSPLPGNKPGVRTLSGSGRSKTPTAEIERFAYRTLELPSVEDESYSAENLRRVTRSLSGTVIRSRAQNISPSHNYIPLTPPTITSPDTSASQLLLLLHIPPLTDITAPQLRPCLLGIHRLGASTASHSVMGLCPALLAKPRPPPAPPSLGPELALPPHQLLRVYAPPCPAPYTSNLLSLAKSTGRPSPPHPPSGRQVIPPPSRSAWMSPLRGTGVVMLTLGPLTPPPPGSSAPRRSDPPTSAPSVSSFLQRGPAPFALPAALMWLGSDRSADHPPNTHTDEDEASVTKQETGDMIDMQLNLHGSGLRWIWTEVDLD
ncbi:hypothetical protein INR49_007316 [Caranx melampygus]|nr:hypothetical protein INR49_007316 [Caranx melampygus]